MAACVKDPVLTGASLAGKENPVTPTTRRTSHQVDDSSSGEMKDILRVERLKEMMLREVERPRPKPQSITAAETPVGQGLLEGNGLLMQLCALGT